MSDYAPSIYTNEAQTHTRIDVGELETHTRNTLG